MDSSKGSYAILTNMMPPYRVELFKYISGKVGTLRIFIDSEMESDRNWPAFDGGLDVRRTWGITFRKKRKYVDAGQDLHLPILMLAQLIQLRPGVVIANQMGIRTLWACVYKAIRPKTNLVLWLTLSAWTERNRGRSRTQFRRWILRQVDAVVVSSDSAKSYVDSLGVNLRVVVAAQPSPMPLARYSPSRFWPETDTSSNLNLLFVGNLSPRKNLLRTIEQLDCWSLENGTSIILRVAGISGDQLPNFSMEKVSIVPLGFLSESELSLEYDNAHALLFPTLEDEWGLVVNEALSRGCLIVGSVYSESVCELVSIGENGWKYQPESLESLSRALSDLGDVLKDKKRLERMQVFAINTAKGASVEGFGDSLLNAACEITPKRTRRPLI